MKGNNHWLLVYTVDVCKKRQMKYLKTGMGRLLGSARRCHVVIGQESSEDDYPKLYRTVRSLVTGLVFFPGPTDLEVHVPIANGILSGPRIFQRLRRLTLDNHVHDWKSVNKLLWDSRELKEVSLRNLPMDKTYFLFPEVDFRACQSIDIFELVNTDCSDGQACFFLKQLCTEMKRRDFVKNLKLVNVQIEGDDIAGCFQYVESLSLAGIRELSLYTDSWTETVFGGMKALRHLSVTQCFLRMNQIKRILHGLGSESVVESLDFSGNRLGLGVWHVHQEALKHVLKMNHMDRESFVDGNFLPVLQGLHGDCSPSLRLFELVGNGTGDRGREELQRILPETRVVCYRTK
eukprot:763117-Hanusia_phi.AAC.7